MERIAAATAILGQLITLLPLLGLMVRKDLKLSLIPAMVERKQLAAWPFNQILFGLSVVIPPIVTFLSIKFVGLANN